jgi:hypothetical protein
VDKDSLAERGRAFEEDFFRKKDRELIERVAAAHGTRTSTATAPLTDARALQELHDLGFTAETVALLPLMPALQAAWAEGGVNAADRQLLMSVARGRGIAEGSAADQQLAEWSGRRPDDAVFSHANRLIRALLDVGRPATAQADDAIRDAEQIAAAGRMLGLAPLSAGEKALLAQLGQKRRS